MAFLVLPSIGTLTLDVTNFLSLHPGLINEIGGHALTHALFSHIRKGKRSGKTLSRRQARKMANRKRRWFVDNIIMHHKRLHDRNREIAVKDARLRALERRKELEKKPQQSNSPSLQHYSRQHHPAPEKWRDRTNIKERGIELRERSRARMIRAQSRWQTILETQHEIKTD